MLCAESIVSYLSQNFITWAWDMTKEANRARLVEVEMDYFKILRNLESLLKIHTT